MMTCPRAAGYKLCHKRELNKSKIALDFGKNIHKVLEYRYKEHKNYLDQSAVEGMVKVATSSFANFQGDQDDFRNYGTAITAIKKYTDTYAFEDFEPYKFASGRLFVELPFAIPLGTININKTLWVRDGQDVISERHIGTITVVQKGKIDLAYRREGRLYGMDHKTTSIMGPQYFSEFELSSQVHCYSWAIQQLCGELPSGYVINGLGIRKPTPSGKSLEFVRHIIPIFPGLVTEWKEDTLHIVADFIEMCARSYLPKHTKWCVGKYGPCEYKQVCGLEPDYRMSSLYSNEYRDATWDPLTD